MPKTIRSALALFCVGLLSANRPCSSQQTEEKKRAQEMASNWEKVQRALREHREKDALPLIEGLLKFAKTPGDLAVLHAIDARCKAVTGAKADQVLKALEDALAAGADWDDLKLWIDSALPTIEALPGGDALVERSFGQRSTETVAVDRLGDATIELKIEFANQARYEAFKALSSPAIGYRPDIDKDPEGHVSEIHGVPVLGPPSAKAALRTTDWEWMPVERTVSSADFDDTSRTYRAAYTIAGLAKRVENRWRLLLPTRPWEAVKSKGVTACLRVREQRAGLAIQRRLVISVQGLSGTPAVEGDERNGYRLVCEQNGDGTVPGTGASASPDLRVSAPPFLKTALYKLYAHRGMSKYWVAKAVFKNSTKETLRNYRIRFRMPGFSEAWSAWEACDVVNPGQTVADAYYPILEASKVQALQSRTPADVEYEMEYQPAKGDKVARNSSVRTALLGINEGIYGREERGDMTEAEREIDTVDLVGAFAQGDDPLVKEVAGQLAHAIGGAPTYEADGAYLFMEALFDFMRCNISYAVERSLEESGVSGQDLRYARDALRTRSGTCINLAIFFASVCTQAGIESHLYIIPGHCFFGARFPGRGKRIVCVECTMCGGGTWDKSRSFAAACASANHKLAHASRLGVLIDVDVNAARARGVVGPELEPLKETDKQVILSKLKFPCVAPSLVGEWICTWKNFSLDQAMELKLTMTRTGDFSLVGKVTVGATVTPLPSKTGTAQAWAGKLHTVNQEKEITDAKYWMFGGGRGFVQDPAGDGIALWFRKGYAAPVDPKLVGRWKATLEGHTASFAIGANGTFTWTIPIENAMAEEREIGSIMAEVEGPTEDKKWIVGFWAIQRQNPKKSRWGRFLMTPEGERVLLFSDFECSEKRKVGELKK